MITMTCAQAMIHLIENYADTARLALRTDRLRIISCHEQRV